VNKEEIIQKPEIVKAPAPFP